MCKSIFVVYCVLIAMLVVGTASFGISPRADAIQKRDRVFHVLTSDWGTLKMQVVTPFARNVDQSTLPDTSSCAIVGERVALGKPSAQSIECSSSQVTDCYVTCTSQHIMGSSRLSRLKSVVVSFNATLHAALRVLNGTAASTGASNTTVCASYVLNASLWSAFDLVVLLTTRPALEPLRTSVTTDPCVFDVYTHRPIVVHANIDPSLLDSDAVAYRSIQRTILHAMGLNLRALGAYIAVDTASRYRDVNATLFPFGPTSCDVDALCSSAYFHKRCFLITPSVRIFARSYFGCSALEGVELDIPNTCATGTLLLQPTAFAYEVLTFVSPAAGDWTYVSNFTFNVLADTGWYLPLFEWADTAYTTRMGSGCEGASGVTTAPTVAPVPGADVGCDSSSPLRCTTTGKCAPRESLCQQCSSGMLQCWNSTCARSMAECGCPPSYPKRCPDGNCTTPWTSCSVQCDPGGVLCWNKECQDNATACPCPPEAPVRCPLGTCAPLATQCPAATAVCPVSEPILCWDGVCVANVTDCRCSNDRPVRCWNGRCVQTDVECLCPSETPLRCPANTTSVGKCVPRLDLCYENATKAPCSSDFVACTNGTCFATLYECPCAEQMFYRPSVQMLAAKQTHYFHMWNRFPATGSFSPCGIDRSYELTYRWNVTDLATFVPLPIRTDLLFFPSLEMPPYTMFPNRSYLLTLAVFAPNGMSSIVSHLISVVEPVPTLVFVGGDRTLPFGDVVEIELSVEDPNFRTGIVQWQCHVPSTLSLCTNTSALIADVHSTTLRVSALPVGSYVFTAQYKSVLKSTSVEVVDSAIPLCFIYAAQRTVQGRSDPTSQLLLKGRIQTTGLTSLKWFINGTASARSSAGTLVLNANELQPQTTTTFSVTARRISDETSECSVSVTTLSAPLSGYCVIHNADSREGCAIYGNNVGTAAYSLMRISAFDFGSDSDIRFRFGYVTTEGTSLLLSSQFSVVPQLYFQAPLLLGNPSVASTRFFVEVSRDVSPLVIATAVCSADLKASSGRTTVSLLEAYLEQLRQAQAVLDMQGVLQVGQRIASMVPDVELANTYRSKLAGLVLSAMHSVITSNSTRVPLSPTTRSIATDILDLLLSHLDRSSQGRMAQQLATELVLPRDSTLDGFDFSRDFAAMSRVLAWCHDDVNSTASYTQLAMHSLSVVDLDSSYSTVITTTPTPIRRIAIGSRRALAPYLSETPLVLDPSAGTDKALRVALQVPSTVYFSGQSIAMKAELCGVAFGSRFMPVKNTSGLPAGNSTPVSSAAWFGLVLVPSVTVSGERSLMTDALQVAVEIVFGVTLSDSYGVAQAVSVHNLSCYAYDDAASTWQFVGNAKTVSDEGLSSESASSAVRFGSVSCSVYKFGLVAVFDVSQFAAPTASPTPKPKTSLAEAIASLSAVAIAGIVVGSLVVVAVVGMTAYSCAHRIARKRRRRRAAESQSEGQQVLLLQDLISRDTLLRGALGLAECRLACKDVL